MPEVRPDYLRRVASDVLAGLGSPADIATKVAGWLVDSDLSGHPSHGVIRLIDYRNRIAKGDLDPAGRPRLVRDGPAPLVDGGRGYGHLAAELLVQTLVGRTAGTPIAAGGVINASHSGRLGAWAELAAASGRILQLCTASLSRGNVAAYGAREARMGTNPISIGVPGPGGDSLILDYATSEISGGKIEHLIQAGEPAPPGSLLDRDGNPTTDPGELAAGGMLLPFGGHKGYGLSLVISLLGGCVVGQADPGNPRHGIFAIAIDPALFAGPELVGAAIGAQFTKMRSTPPRPGFGQVEIPGDYERQNRAAGQLTLSVPAATWEGIVALGESLGLTLTSTD